MINYFKIIRIKYLFEYYEKYNIHNKIFIINRTYKNKLKIYKLFT